jgi:hypothetical protein
MPFIPETKHQEAAAVAPVARPALPESEPTTPRNRSLTFRRFTRGGDHTLLETAEQGEDAAKEAYQKALRESVLRGSVRQILMKQQSHVQQSHDQVKAFRDRKVA